MISTSFRSPRDRKAVSNSIRLKGGEWISGDSLGSLFSIKPDSMICTELPRFTDNEIFCIEVDEASNIGVLAAKNDLFRFDPTNILEGDTPTVFYHSTLPICCCAIDSKGNIFVGGKDPSILVFGQSQLIDYRISSGDVGVKALSLHISNSLIAYANFAGSIVICSIIYQGNQIVGCDQLKTISSVASLELVRSDEFGYKLSWHPKMACIAAPSTGGFISTAFSPTGSESWVSSDIAPPHSVRTAGTDLCLTIFSSEGTYLCSGDALGVVNIWSVIVKKSGGFIQETNFEFFRTIQCQFANDLDRLRDFGLFNEHSELSPTSMFLTSRTSFGTVENIFSKSSESTSNAVRNGLSRLKSRNQKEEDDEEEEDPVFSSDKAFKSFEGSRAFEDDDDDIVESSLENSLELLQKIPKPSAVSASTFHGTVQLSSTKVDERGRCYLVWNSVGNITTRIESVSNRIEIRFNNSLGKNKQEAFPDNFGFTMASLSHEGAIFASDPVEMESSSREVLGLDEIDGFSKRKVSIGSTLYYHPFAVGSERLHGANESFTMTLNNDEAALSVAVGCGWIAVATSLGFLRFFSSTGLQFFLAWVKGPVVCLCASDNQLAVIYNHSTVLKETYQLNAELFQVFSSGSVLPKIIANISVPLCPLAQLTWVGYSVEGSNLFVLDSSGVLSMLFRTDVDSWIWMPVLCIDRIKKSSEHKFWPIMVKGEKFAYVLLNGESRPEVHPQPVVSTQSFRLPIVESKDGKDKGAALNEKTQQFLLEMCKQSHLQSKFRDTLDSSDATLLASLEESFHLQQNETDKVILKLLQESCRQQRTAQAFDLVFRISTEKALQVAITVANHFGKSNVAELAQSILTLKNQSSSFVDEIHSESGDPILPSKELSQISAGGLGSSVFVSRDADLVSDVVRPALNPFATSLDSPQKKRIGPLEGLRSLKGSPSPKRQMMRQSSFSHEAKSKSITDKTFL